MHKFPLHRTARLLLLIALAMAAYAVLTLLDHAAQADDSTASTQHLATDAKNPGHIVQTAKARTNPPPRSATPKVAVPKTLSPAKAVARKTTISKATNRKSSLEPKGGTPLVRPTGEHTSPDPKPASSARKQSGQKISKARATSTAADPKTLTRRDAVTNKTPASVRTATTGKTPAGGKTATAGKTAASETPAPNRPGRASSAESSTLVRQASAALPSPPADPVSRPLGRLTRTELPNADATPPSALTDALHRDATDLITRAEPLGQVETTSPTLTDLLNPDVTSRPALAGPLHSRATALPLAVLPSNVATLPVLAELTAPDATISPALTGPLTSNAITLPALTGLLGSDRATLPNLTGLLGSDRAALPSLTGLFGSEAGLPGAAETGVDAAARLKLTVAGDEPGRLLSLPGATVTHASSAAGAAIASALPRMPDISAYGGRGSAQVGLGSDEVGQGPADVPCDLGDRWPGRNGNGGSRLGRVSGVPTAPSGPGQPGDHVGGGASLRDSGGGASFPIGTVPSSWWLNDSAAGFSVAASVSCSGRTTKYCGPPS
ncbi:hypothetical protein SAMN05421748_12631 [Paractinoplanes atraurantiacus]|uniref:Uncharacterized protein n=1 Tax=Paractinoplanes atraurantiacus TaxID=1036182 RepID=A0A285JUQ6_9ACTN|nr:hypothetical protein SAMN05421748_12631 [Actinoplanes atraurantiacus]